MPLNAEIRKVLVIGSGPIVIGQAAEFDYAGTQACFVLKQEGLEAVLVNSNPATIMTDNAMASEIYVEPLTLSTVKRIIEKEKPDSILSTLGGQTGLTLSMQLAKEGFLDEHNVKLLGASLETIDRAEDRLCFKTTMESIQQPTIPSEVVEDIEDAVKLGKEFGYPLVIRPAFTLGGTGGGIVHNETELREIGSNGLRLSPITQILVEKCVSGWKEIEFEVMRDGGGNVITVCSMENVDPVGVHTGDSVVVAPAVSLTEEELQILRQASLDIVSALEVEGGCNIQLAVNPDPFEYAIIEVNPRVSRSSALASKATGYPIARVATKIAIGYTIPEITGYNEDGTLFEPQVDYIVAKVPKWPFDKFVYANRTLGTQMKATGEVMSIGDSFEQAIMKAVRGVEIGLDTLTMPEVAVLDDKTVRQRLHTVDDRRLFVVYEALKRGISIEDIYDITKFTPWFLERLNNLAQMELQLAAGHLDETIYKQSKQLGFPDSAISRLSGQKPPLRLEAAFKVVDTCNAAFGADMPYFYSVYGEHNEAKAFLDSHPSDKKTVIVFGAGPIRIGQGIEFDYASVHCVWALKEAGYDVVIVNNNPETVSTDFTTADRLYFEPLTTEDVDNVLATEKPYGVVVAFGGQTAIKLTRHLESVGANILGTPPDSIDRAEDRERFDALLTELQIKRPAGHTVMTEPEALEAANELGYPVLMRPSYVLGGQNMIIAFNDDDIREYMTIILSQKIKNPVLIDKYLQGIEIEVDAICDGEEVLIPGVMEHIERAGIHSGDSIAVYPAWNLSGEQLEKVTEYTKQLAVALQTQGLINIQYLVYEGEIYVIEVNPRSSRTIPYITKVTGVPMVDLATRAMLGEKVADMGFGTGLYKVPPYVAVKVPVFSFEKLLDVDTHLGPEMKSTGEVLGIGKNLAEGLYKGLVAAGYRMNRSGGVLVTVANHDKREIAPIVQKWAELGFQIFATVGTADVLEKSGISVTRVNKMYEMKNKWDIAYMLEHEEFSYIISTSSRGRLPERDSVRMRRKAVEHGIPCLTSLDTAEALADSLRSRYSERTIELVDINRMRQGRRQFEFTKMQISGNDYIYFNCLDNELYAPESLAVSLTDRHFGIGGDGIVLVQRSEVADARFRIFNRDGSEGRMGGNIVCCIGRYLYEKGIIKADTMQIESLSGVHQVRLFIRNDQVYSVTAEAGKAALAPADIPVNLPGERIVNVEQQIGEERYRITCVSMGNPHCVSFFSQLDDLDLEKIGPAFENHPLFPERVNAEFVTVINKNTLRVRVWERGNGETMACGTGACAAAVAAVLNGHCKKGEDILVKLKGGHLTIRYTDDETVYMSGKPEIIYDGAIQI